jgi:hypothetical protein
LIYNLKATKIIKLLPGWPEGPVGQTKQGSEMVVGVGVVVPIGPSLPGNPAKPSIPFSPSGLNYD